MATLKVYYGGWLKMPANLLRGLGVKTGDTIKIGLGDDCIVLRSGSGKREVAAEVQSDDAILSEPAGDILRVLRRKREASGAKASVTLPPALCGAGRPKPPPPPGRAAEEAGVPRQRSVGLA